MMAVVEQALALWGMEGAVWSLAAERENTVYRVQDGPADYALRLRRPGYRTEAELLSELHWMQAMTEAGLHVPRPVAALTGGYLQRIGGLFVDMVTWLPGRPLGKSGVPLAVDTALFADVGAEMARMHLACDRWTPPPGFARCAWDVPGLVGDAPLWGRFWDNPTLSQDERQTLTAFRDRARADLADLTQESGLTPDYGLIHADLVRENIMLHGDRIQMIDFDDGGYGFRLFDLATALLKNLSEPEYPALKAALLAGYQRIRPIDVAPLDLFIALRATTYVGWTISRMAEDGSSTRNRRFIAAATALCGAYLAQDPRSLS